MESRPAKNTMWEQSLETTAIFQMKVNKTRENKRWVDSRDPSKLKLT